MSKQKVWYQIYGDGETESNILLAKVKSKGLAYIVAKELSNHYKNVTVK